MALLLPLQTGTTVAADSRPCRVRNTTSGQVHTHLSRAIRAARSGHKLVVTGACRGRVVIDRNLTIVGHRTAGRRARVFWAPKGTALTVRRDVSATLVGLNVVGWDAKSSLGVANRGSLTLRDLIVVQFESGVTNSGSLRLFDARVGNQVTDETTRNGIVNRGRLLMQGDSRIGEGWHAHALVNTGTAIMQGHSRIVNHAFRHSLSAVLNRGRFVMRGRTSVTHSTPYWAAVHNAASGRFFMLDASSISHNSVGRGGYGEEYGSQGGGVHNRGMLVMRDNSSIHHNDNAYFQGAYTDFTATGGGVHNRGTLMMFDSASIHDNTAAPDGLGGGLYSSKGGTLVGVRCGPGTGANVYGNSPEDCVFEE